MVIFSKQTSAGFLHITYSEVFLEPFSWQETAFSQEKKKAKKAHTPENTAVATGNKMHVTGDFQQDFWRYWVFAVGEFFTIFLQTAQALPYRKMV